MSISQKGYRFTPRRQPVSLLFNRQERVEPVQKQLFQLFYSQLLNALRQLFPEGPEPLVQSPLSDQPQTGHLKTLSRRPSSV